MIHHSDTTIAILVVSVSAFVLTLAVAMPVALDKNALSSASQCEHFDAPFSGTNVAESNREWAYSECKDECDRHRHN